MAQPQYYTYSGAFIPGTLARAEQVGVEYTSVQTGFAKLAIQGVDSGAANAYVVTTSGGQCGSYTDGLIVEAKLLNGNTGVATIAVDGGSVVGLTQPNGQTLASGALVANNWYRMLYNSTYSAWTVIAPTPATTITTNTISASAPTNKVGLTAAGGVSTACIPIDITFALDQTIAPTMTGAWVFSNTVTFNSTVSFATGLTLMAAANAYALTLNTASTVGQSKGLLVNAGTNASDVCAQFFNQSGATNYLEVKGEGSVIVGNPTGGGQGVGTINAAGVFINGVAAITASASGANPTASVGLSAVNGSAATFLRSDGAPALSQAISPTWTAAHTFSGGAYTNITINAAANQTGLIVNGGTNTSNAYALEVITGQGAGFSSGLLIKAGTNSSDIAFLINNAANSANYMIIYGDGSGILGSSSTVGMQWTSAGAITLNASSGTPLTVKANTTAVFEVLGTTAPTIEGYGPTAGALVDMTPDTGSFTMTYTGMTGSVTGTAFWTRVGNLVLLMFPAGVGTSNTTAWTATGLPTGLRPARTQHIALAYSVSSQDSGFAEAVMTASSSTITFWASGSATGWTNSGNKGMTVANTIAYLLN